MAVAPRFSTPAYSSSAQLAGVPPDMLMLKDVDATDVPALVDHISDRTAVPLFTKARNAQVDPLSVIELMEDEVLPSAHTATTVLPFPLVYGIDSEVGLVFEPVLLAAPPTREIVDATTVKGVEKLKLPEVAGPAEFTERTA